MRVADLRPYHVTQWVDTRKMAKRGRKVKGTKNTYRTEDTDRPIGQNHKRNLIRAVKGCLPLG